MTTDTLDAFEAGCDEHGVGVTVTDAADLAGALADAVEPPAVGVPLPFDGALAEADVTLDPTPAEIQAARTGVTPASFGIAEHGTFFLESDRAGTEPVSLYPERHVGVVAASDVVPDVAAAFDRLEGVFADGGASGILATGASATADMGAMVEGVHGPGEVHAVVVRNR